MPPNSFGLNQTCIFPHPQMQCTAGKEGNRIRNCFVLLLNFKKILELLAKDITQYLLTYVAQCFTWSLTWVYVCFLSPLSLFVWITVRVPAHAFLVFLLLLGESGSWKRKDSGGIFLARAEARASWAAAMQFHRRVATFRPIHPSLLSPIREDGQVNMCTWKTSSSRR